MLDFLPLIRAQPILSCPETSLRFRRHVKRVRTAFNFVGSCKLSKDEPNNENRR